MQRRILFCLLVLVQAVYAQKPISKIAFGSCGHEDHPLPVFRTIVQQKPDLFIFLGDNIYADTDDMQVMRRKYGQLAANKGFQALRASTPIIATWDDHDFGRNDAGRHYPYKDSSKQIILEFFKEPAASGRRQRAGIYTSYYYQQYGKTLQIILLDNRTFRDNLLPYRGEVKNDPRYKYELDYAPHTSKDSTLLGEAQWKWLEQELRKPADLRIIGSSTQFSIEFNGYEAWANFPHEQERMLNLIKETKANGVLFLSGDVHYAELSKLQYPGLYPIYDLTSSGLSSTWDFATPNRNRIKGPVMENHFGMVTIDWQKTDPLIQLEIKDVPGKQRIVHQLKLSELQLK